MRSAILVVLFAAAARGDDVSTAEFLGDEATWDRARVELRDVHGLWGGQDVRVEGSGRVIVRDVDRTRRERRYEVALPKEEARALLRLAVEGDVLRAPVSRRMGKPDEARPRLVLVSARGLDRELAKWASDPVPAFDRVQRALVELAKAVVAKEKPAFEGRHDPAWRPAGTVVVRYAIYSGREDPRFELTPEEVKTLGEKLKGLPRLEEEPRFGMGAVLVELAPGVMRWVQDGKVGGGSFAGGGQVVSPSEVLRDVHGLEAWLRELAKGRGIELP